MKNIRDFLSENFQFLEVKFSIYLNRRVFVMTKTRDEKETDKTNAAYETDDAQTKKNCNKETALELSHLRRINNSFNSADQNIYLCKQCLS